VHPCGGQLGRRIEQPGDDQRQGQIASGLRGAARQQLIETDAPGDAQRGQDVAMRQRAADLEAARAEGNEGIAAQGGTQGFDPLERQLGEVGRGAVLDLAVPR
jgi:hypothetical protein